MSLDHVPGALRASADVVSVGVAIGTIAQLLPPIAAALTIIWTLIQIYETETVRSLMGRPQRVRFADPVLPNTTNQEKQDG